MAMGTKTVLSLRDFEQLADDGMPHELDEGELLTMSPAKKRHGDIQTRIAFELGRFLLHTPLGRVYVAETGFLLQREPATLRVPDVSFLTAERASRLSPDDWLEGAPDLAVEVVSPSDTASYVLRKVSQYLHFGSRVVWVAYPDTEEIHVYEASGGVRILHGEQALEAPGLLPGFSLPVRSLFE